MSFQETGMVVPRAETQPKERLLDSELGDLLSAIGNHEAKAILLGLMSPDSIYSLPDANRAMKIAQGHYKGWAMGPSVAFDYLGHSMAPIGLVAREVTVRDGAETVGFVKTKRGEDLGNPLAGLLLDFSLRHPDYSLIDFFASAHSRYPTNDDLERRKRAPSLRQKMLWEIVTSHLPISTTNLANSIGETVDSIGPHLRHLSERGIVSYRTVGQGDGLVYTVNPDRPETEPTHQKGRKSIAIFIINTISGLPEEDWPANVLTDKYIKENGKSQINRTNLANHVGSVLRDLERQGYIKRPLGKGRSGIQITDEQRSVLIDLVGILDRFQTLDPATIAYGRTRLVEIVSDPRSVSVLLAKAREHSPFTKGIPRDISRAQLRLIILERPRLTGAQLRALLSAEQGRKLSPSEINSLLSELRDSGELSISKQNGLQVYSVAQVAQPQDRFGPLV